MAPSRIEVGLFKAEKSNLFDKINTKMVADTENDQLMNKIELF